MISTRQIDENKFFREVTTRIFGSLEIETALKDAFNYLKDIIPLEKIILSATIGDIFAGVRLLAMADDKGGYLLDDFTKFTRDIRNQIEKKMFHPDNKTKKDVISLSSEELLPFYEIMESQLSVKVSKSSSILVLLIEIGETEIGAVIFVSPPKIAYSNEVKDLIKILRTPFSTAFVNSIQYQNLINDNIELYGELTDISTDVVIGSETGLKHVVEISRKVSTTDSPVLITGETGVGKEVIANLIHQLSSKRNGPLIKVNCGAIPETLIDSELFGHEKGAFTGAIFTKKGKFERANNGTIFLDEISELTPSAQVKLLRLLQNKEFERVGGEKTMKLDVRVIAATNRNLEEMVNNGHFREDLWYRLNVFPINIPPLRNRKQDIPLLVKHFINKNSRAMNLTKVLTLSPGALEQLISYNWPGNVRELQNVIERGLIISKGHPLNFPWLRVSTTVPKSNPELKTNSDNNEVVKLDDAMKEHILKALRQTHGRISGQFGCAKLLNINPNTLRNRMKKLGISWNQDL